VEVGGALPARTWKKPRDHLYHGGDHDAGVADGDGGQYGDEGVSEEVGDSEESADYENQDAEKQAEADSNKDDGTNEVDDETNGVDAGDDGDDDGGDGVDDGEATGSEATGSDGWDGSGGVGEGTTAQVPTKILPPIVATVSAWNEKVLLEVFKGTRRLRGNEYFSVQYLPILCLKVSLKLYGQLMFSYLNSIE